MLSSSDTPPMFATVPVPEIVARDIAEIDACLKAAFDHSDLHVHACVLKKIEVGRDVKYIVFVTPDRLDATVSLCSAVWSTFQDKNKAADAAFRFNFETLDFNRDVVASCQRDGYVRVAGTDIEIAAADIATHLARAESFEQQVTQCMAGDATDAARLVAVICLFYAALHRVDAHFKAAAGSLGDLPDPAHGSHWNRSRTLMEANGLTDVFGKYDLLHRLADRARYNPEVPVNAEDFATACEMHKGIRAGLDCRLERQSAGLGSALDSRPPWLKALLAHGRQEPDGAMVRGVLTGCAEFIRQRQWEELNALYAVIDPDDLHEQSINSLLRAPFIYRERLPSWQDLLEKSEAALTARGEDAGMWLQGLQRVRA